MENNSQILNFWFPNNNYNIWWFKSNEILDKKIYDNYFTIMIDTFINHNTSKYIDANPESIVESIILLDQFSRNINRITNNLDVKEYTKKARELSQIWIDKKYYLTEPILHTVFAFLPIRHLNDVEQMKHLIKILEEMESNIDSLKSNKVFDTKIISNKVFDKFKLHTLRQFNIISN